MLRPLFLLPLLLATACASTDITSRNAAADFGTAIAQRDCQELVKRHVGATLLKPNTAKYKFGRCMPDTLSARPLLGLPKQNGYAMSFAVDAQNSWNSYTGYRKYEVLIYDGVVVRRLRQSHENGMWETF